MDSPFEEHIKNCDVIICMFFFNGDWVSEVVLLNFDLYYWV